MSKKFLDQAGLSYFASKYPDNTVLETAVNIIGEELDKKANKEVLSELKKFGPTDIVSFEANNYESKLLLKSCIINILATQEGEGIPSLENIRLINGQTNVEIHITGSNFCGSEYLMERIQASMPSATLNYENNTAQFKANLTVSENIINHKHINFKKNTAYTLIFTGSHSLGTTSNMRLYYTDNTYVLLPKFNKAKTVWKYTSNPQKTISAITKTNSSGITTLYCNECGIFEGIINIEDFVPYKGNIYNINWFDQINTSIYSGTLDIVTGKLIATHNLITLDGSEPWSIDENENNKYILSLFDLNQTVSSVDTFAICSHYLNIDDIEENQDYDVFSISSNNIIIYDISNTFENLDAFKAYLTEQYNAQTPVQILYKLNDIITYNINSLEIPILFGQNNIWSNIGNIEQLEYGEYLQFLYKKIINKANQENPYFTGTLKLGNTTLTESQLQALLALIE